MSPLVLASASPRRAELLRTLLPRFDVVPCPLPEPQRRPAAVSPPAWASALAYFKARATAEAGRPAWVLGADTIVVCGRELLGKPADAADARRMLYAQCGRSSQVITGVCLLHLHATPLEVRRYVAHDATCVVMRDDPRAIDAYVAGGEWQGKAGAYGIQDVGDRLVERITGSFSNVVGLPLELVGRLLRRAGVLV